MLRKKLWIQRLIAACPYRFHLRKMTTRHMARVRRAAQRYSFGTKRVPRKVPLFRTQRTHAPRRAPRQARPFFPAYSSLRPSERIKQSVRLHGLTSAASRPPPRMGGRGQVLCLRRGQTLCLFRGLAETVSVSFASLRFARNAWTQRKGTACPHKFHLRKITTRQTARLRKGCAAVLFWHQKSTQKSAAVRTQRTRAPRRAPRQARPFFLSIFVTPS